MESTPLPDGTERVVLLHKTLRCRVDDDKLNHWLQDNEVANNAQYVVFAAGDEIPLEVARSVWSGFSDRLAAVDADDQRLDTQSRAESMGFAQGMEFPHS